MSKILEKGIIQHQKINREKEIGPNMFFLFYGPDFVDHLLKNGWLLKVISVRWDTEYGSGIFNMHIVRGSVSSFIRKHILDIVKIELYYISPKGIATLRLTPYGTNLDGMTEEEFKRFISNKNFPEEIKSYLPF
ncbi:MAG: hypothetical protein ACTSSP_01710 [Candidatus Asgardarchaeia archaeon]